MRPPLSARRTRYLTAATAVAAAAALIVGTSPGASARAGAPAAGASPLPSPTLTPTITPTPMPTPTPTPTLTPPPTGTPTTTPTSPGGYPIFTVLQEGLVQSQGAAIAQAYGIPNALASNGAFSYTDAVRYAQVPQTVTGSGTDKQGRPTTSQALNMTALGQIVVLPDATATARAQQLVSLANLGPLFTTAPTVSHDTLTLADKTGRTTGSFALDTTVSYRITLAGLPVTGQGSRLRITFAPDGTVTQVSDSQRALQQVGTASVVSVSQATAQCAALYGPGVGQGLPTLGYQYPALTAQQADGRGTVTLIYPQYTCNPIGSQGQQAGRLVPAVLGSGPTAMVTASRSGNAVTASVAGLSGGTAPYTYQWSSTTTVLTAAQSSGPSTSYTLAPRDPSLTDEQVSVQITDTNGLATTATIDLPGTGSGSLVSVPGGGGLEALGTTVGIEQTVAQWQCAQDSANGFNNVMTANGVAVNFDWRGLNAWQTDFVSAALGGNDNQWVDNVDDTWYTGHGWPGGFTFAGNNNAKTITPAQIQWGDNRVDWVQLESCDVLQDTTNTNDYFGRWGPTLDGLHVLSGFGTPAFCIAGGTGGTFAGYLFPFAFLWWARPALPVQTAWAATALDREPAGVIYRSMGPIGPGNVTDIGDYFWGQGAVGPDIFAANEIGYWSISGTV
jgi:Family of unknown function (DUF6345)